MIAFARFALWAWIPIALLIFAVLKPRRAVLVAYIGAWMFLPMYDIKMNGIPDLSKITVASMGVILGMLCFDLNTVLKFRPSWYDLPMLAWCLLPFVTSMKNDLGDKDGYSNVLTQIFIWGIPYFVGRCYFKDWEGIRELGMGIFIGGLIYLPLCWFEIRISPQLHKWLYGFRAHTFNQELRWGGYRPQVFMQSGLAVAMWMTSAALVGVWLWVTGAVKKVKGVPMALIVPVMVVTSIFCKSSGAMMFLFIGIGTLLWVKYLRNPLPLLVLIAVPPVYMYERSTLNWDGTWLIDQATKVFGEERGNSLGTRIRAENKLTSKAFNEPIYDEDTPMTQADPIVDPWFGRGRWDPSTPGRAPWRIYAIRIKADQMNPGQEIITWQDMCPTDGLWVITLGQFGVASLLALTVTILLPPLILWLRVPLRLWSHPVMATAAPLAVLLAIHMCDNLLNAMINPIFILAAGGISAIGPSLRKLYHQYQMQQAQSAAQGFPITPTGPTAEYAPAAYGQRAGVVGQSPYGSPAGYGPAVPRGPARTSPRPTWQR